MLEMLDVRILIIAAMLLIMGYFDLKNREIDDRIFIAFAAIAGILYVFDYNVNHIDVMVMVLSIPILVAGWKVRYLQTGDFFVALIITYTLPVFTYLPLTNLIDIPLPTNLLIIGGATFTTMFASVAANVSFNLSEWRAGWLFKGIKDSKKKKALMFFLCHRHRKLEKYIMVSEDDGRLDPWRQKYLEAKMQTSYYINYCFPFITMMAPTSVFLALIATGLLPFEYLSWLI